MSIQRIPVLMYHGIENEQHHAGSSDLGEQRYVLSERSFLQQMQYLHSNNFQTFLLSELRTLKSWPVKSVVITFDDGHRSNYTLALPILNKFGFKAEFYITTDWIGKANYLNPEDIIRLSNAGMSIGTHGTSHRYFNNLPRDSQKHELTESTKKLKRIIGKNIFNLSMPGGRFTDSTVSLALNSDLTTLATSKTDYLTSENFLNIPRFALIDTTTIAEFQKIVNQHPRYLLKIKTKSLLLQFAKSLLGNQLYDSIRGWILNLRNILRK